MKTVWTSGLVILFSCGLVGTTLILQAPAIAQECLGLPVGPDRQRCAKETARGSPKFQRCEERALALGFSRSKGGKMGDFMPKCMRGAV